MFFNKIHDFQYSICAFDILLKILLPSCFLLFLQKINTSNHFWVLFISENYISKQKNQKKSEKTIFTTYFHQKSTNLHVFITF